MSTSKKTIEFWEKSIAEQHESGLTVEEYCQLIEKPTHRFYYWKRRFAEKSRISHSNDSDAFVEISQPCTIQAIAGRSSDQIEIRIGECTLFFTTTTDPLLFKTAASVLLELVG
ncbi:MAG: hypothetical protein BWY39_01983 [Spirochaetes bacterium ADurb.Bin269]|nr:MAG: hypothetical protein BWY39_01983 [Spirochaetes bacterium ADurb.Bin269]